MTATTSKTTRTWLLATVLAAALPLAATAADVRVPAAKAPAYIPPAPVAPIYSWTGFYVGAHVGGAWADTSWAFPYLSGRTGHTSGGFLGGGQVGANYQVGSLVLGAEGDFSWSSADGSSNCLGVNCRTRLDWLSTVTGRVGYAAGPALIYAKGGAAWAHDRYSISSGGLAGGTSQTKGGWTAGLGLEFMLTPNWSAKAEYNYADLGKDRVIASGGTTLDVNQKVHAAKFGLNYRFNWDGPPVIGR
jgi:outer membrane immunogenic protein